MKDRICSFTEKVYFLFLASVSMFLVLTLISPWHYYQECRFIDCVTTTLGQTDENAILGIEIQETQPVGSAVTDKVRVSYNLVAFSFLVVCHA
ncbi:hypothetical protein DFA_07855 [Cavenderia fasciculata]|uniref:Uncharacterized protein n=1 Tax=Cavenderia fasciculata TaxID=261658 RepID=F4Q3Q9_CACFS|nr:uncharacterized protein DFA_07855 [Cavenderia fasciculata]EGG16875.1 hypothetical protein DFA_07855 [Cavenderia fasciculata]|eukprot:XP_004355349.1 hypothetical protein DFA_07855 [Cavenderia fasciculata]